jgi:hypothetical protein
MAREDVNIRVSANIAEAIRMWKAMEAGPKGMANEMAGMGRTGQAAARGMGAEFNRVIGQWTTLAVKINIAKQLLTAYMQANREAQQRQDTSSLRLDTMSRQFQVQSGTPEGSMEALRQKILATTNLRGAKMDTGFAGATQLVSSGFSVSEVVENGGLDAFLEGLNATAATGKDIDPKSLAFAVAGHLKATKQDLTADNIRKAFQEIYGLFKDTNLQTENLARFASEAAIINAKTGMQNEMLAPFSQLVDITDEARASTSMRSMVTKLTGAGANSRATMGLAEMGLTPDQVDMVGESFFDVQNRMATAGAGMSKEDRNLALQMIFGEEAQLAAETLLSEGGAAETQRRLARSKDPAEYRAAAATSASSLAAEENRADIDEVKAYADLNTVTSDTARKRLMAGLKERGAWMPTRTLAGQGFDLAIGAGASVEEALDFATPGQAPWRALGNAEEAEQFKRQIMRRGPDATSGSAAQHAMPQQVEVKVHLLDQNNQRMPHRSDVQNVGKNKGGR